MGFRTTRFGFMRKMIIPALILTAVCLTGCASASASHHKADDDSAALLKPPGGVQPEAPDAVVTTPPAVSNAQACASTAAFTKHVADENASTPLDELTATDSAALSSLEETLPDGALATDVYSFDTNTQTQGVGGPDYFTGVLKMAKDCAGYGGMSAFAVWDSSAKVQSVAAYEATIAAQPDPDTYVLKVTGTGSAIVTYVTLAGESQQTVSLPWSKSLPDTAVDSGIISMNAQEQGAGTIGCSIQLGSGQPVTNSSSGNYAVVSCITN